MAQKKMKVNAANGADALFNPEVMKDFIRFFEKVDIAEVEIKIKDKSLLLNKKSRSAMVAAAPSAMPVMETRFAAPAPTHIPAETPKAAASEKSAGNKTERPKNLVEITAPLVGTFYRSPEPGAAPFFQVGDVIEPGKTVCLIEAMKIFNEIKSEVRGTVKEVCVENEQPVEFGQVLYLVEVK